MQKQFDFSQFGPFTNKEVRKAFDSFDLDKNGFIGVGELRTIYTAIGEEVTDAELDEMIKMVDTDGDGQCDFSEFQKMIFRYAERAYDEDEISDTGDEKDEGAHRDTKHSVVVKKPVKESKALDTKKRAAHLREVISKLKISQETIDAVFKKFTKSDKPSIMYTEFCELMERPKSKDMAELFGLFGGKGTAGNLDVREFLVGLSGFCATSKKDRIAFAFKLFDEDGSGFISRPELVKILKVNYMATSASQVQKKADAIMRQADKDGDHQISMEEFEDVCARFPNLLFPQHNSFKN
uniref:EF-hand domain-containing protein n=1 Tax=Lotharella globosa TaxID=91324 RepID=A0A7S3ZDF8_9EUKA|mmetsp:Transcript_8444/g.16367  ORF Transcript_8444/g.16367 Transcript_8444/m.16367 type:complete len:295 (+) Transcript_8444:76-960(+)